MSNSSRQGAEWRTWTFSSGHCTIAISNYVLLLGEATFHQVHGGVSTSVPMDQHPWDEFHREYQAIRGKRFVRIPRRPTFIGEVSDEASAATEFSKRVGAKIWGDDPAILAE